MSGVAVSDPIVLHQYKHGPGGTTVLCGGKWFRLGESPCELMSKETVAALADVPPCDTEDLVAAALVLNLNTISRCMTKTGGSG